jgi:hypothetical protein
MSSSRLFIPAAIAALALALAGCSLDDDGPRTTQTRDLGAFTRIENRASVDVRLHVGAPQRVRVLAGENVIDDVRTEVHGGTLEIAFDHHGLGGSVTLEAYVPRLTGVTASGSGNIDADGVEADDFEVRSEGSADIGLAGAVRRLAVDMEGSGDADLADLDAREAHVSVDGSGDADVRAAQRLAIELDGSGDVRYHGDPVVSQHRDGSGGIIRAD